MCTLCNSYMYMCSCMYMHMLRPTSVEELKEFRPSLGQNLHDMVSYKEDDFEDIYDLTFSVSKFFKRYISMRTNHPHTHTYTYKHTHTYTHIHVCTLLLDTCTMVHVATCMILCSLSLPNQFSWWVTRVGLVQVCIYNVFSLFMHVHVGRSCQLWRSEDHWSHSQWFKRQSNKGTMSWICQSLFAVPISWLC